MSTTQDTQELEVRKGKTAEVDTMLTVGGRVIIVRAGQLLPAEEAQATTELATPTSQTPQGAGELPAAPPGAALPKKIAASTKPTQPKGGKK